MRKFWIHVELVYQTFNLIFSWFALGNYYIAFTILSDGLEDKEFNIKGINIVNDILQYFYLGMLIMCFLLSLGNRPQGSKWGYTMAFIGFGLITVYMTVRTTRTPAFLSARLRSHERDVLTGSVQFAAFFLAAKGLQNVADVQGRPIQASDFFSNSIFRNIVFSLAATLGLYIIASLIFVRDVVPTWTRLVELTNGLGSMDE